jgi:isocitrate/isopropylmalate dehydrogenase
VLEVLCFNLLVFTQSSSVDPDVELSHLRYSLSHLRYSMDLPEQAERVEKAIRTVLHNAVRTGDIWQKGCQRVGTHEMGDAVLSAL